jgi:hypothetical protein
MEKVSYKNVLKRLSKKLTPKEGSFMASLRDAATGKELRQGVSGKIKSIAVGEASSAGKAFAKSMPNTGRLGANAKLKEIVTKQSIGLGQKGRKMNQEANRQMGRGAIKTIGLYGAAGAGAYGVKKKLQNNKK